MTTTQQTSPLSALADDAPAQVPPHGARQTVEPATQRRASTRWASARYIGLRGVGSLGPRITE